MPIHTEFKDSEYSSVPYGYIWYNMVLELKSS
jgi:hypothetical protein